ncbi:MAG: DUF488 domain-containing protein [Candidatus Deferrimicrobiaceae bacterium]
MSGGRRKGTRPRWSCAGTAPRRRRRSRSSGCRRRRPIESGGAGNPGGRTPGIRVKRVYDPPDVSDGYRVLVDRLWPRGLKREDRRIGEWRPDLAPTHVLRKWFDHDPAKWDEFRVRYRNELDAAGKMADLRLMKERAERRTLTLLYAAKDGDRNNAAALREILEEID